MNHIGPSLNGDKLLVALDLDGVLYRWTEAALDTLHEGRGVVVEPYGEDEYWDQIKGEIGKDDWHWLWNSKARKQMFRTGRSYADGIRGARELMKLATVVIVTRRPSDAMAGTMAWLSNHNLNPHGLVVIGGGHKHEHPFAQNFDVLIDDNPEIARGWRDAWDIPVFMPARRYNGECEGEEGIIRFSDWTVVLDWVKERE